MSKVEIYSTPTCVFCHHAKDFFNENDIEYTEYNVGSDLEKRQEMVQKSGQMGVPVIDVDGEITVGFDEDKLRSLLKL
jgi:glutaredoxin-like YruB-family protein